MSVPATLKAPNRGKMATTERLFLDIFNTKRRIERQLHQQFKSYGESLACNIMADGRRPPPWLLGLASVSEIPIDPGECRHPSSFRNKKRKSRSATWEFIQDESDFQSCLHDCVIAPTVNKQNKISHVVEEIHSATDEVRPTVNKQASITSHIVEEIINACSKDEVRPANFVPFDSGFHHTFQCRADAFENKNSESHCHREGSDEGEDPYDAKDRRIVTSISDTAGVESRCDLNMPEFEGFVFDRPYEVDNIIFKDVDFSNLAKERAFVLEQLRQSSILLTPRPKSSIMNKIDIISDVFNSSPLGILQKMDLDFSQENNNPVIEQFTSTSSINPMGMFCNKGSQLDGPVFESSHSLSSLSGRFGSELQSLLLSPPAIKFSHARLSGKTSSRTVKVSSNPELVCFRIDENSSTTEENADAVQECLVRDSLEFVNSDAASSLGFEYPDREYNLKSKDNHRFKLGKSTKTASKRAKTPLISCRSSDRIRNNQNVGKGSKQSNILSNISSFIPQIQQKQQQALPLQRKKNIKVKALEAAEAAKRLEDQMKLEREKRKAAVKLEREKLRQENTELLKLKQKQKAKVGRKKEEIAARKRQREAEERKMNDRKRQCIEETRTLQREHSDKLHCWKAENVNRKKTTI